MIDNVNVTVFNEEQYDGEWPPLNAVDALAWLAEKINLIPEEFRESAQLEIDARAGYGGSAYAVIEIYYTRPETDEEKAKREANLKASADHLRDCELRKLAELKAKYEAS